jgi:hypothetical protein
MSVVVKKILEKLAKKAKPRGKPKGILKQKIEYVKSIPGKNTKKRTYIVSPHAPIMSIEEYGKKYGKNLPASTTKKVVLHATGGLIKGKPKLAKKGWK